MDLLKSSLFGAIALSVISVQQASAAYFADQWALENRGQRVCRFDGRNCMSGKVGADIKAKAAWARHRDCRAIVTAVLDTGADFRHPDLSANLLQGRNFVDSVDSTVPNDDNLHGSHVTGIIAASGTEAKGVNGVCNRARILPVKVGSAEGYITDADVLEGIAYAASQGAKVVNGSFGGGPNNNLIKAAIQKASGILFIFAAGNGDMFGRGFSIDKQPVYPASYQLANIVAVAATDSQDRLGTFSNFGSRSVHLAAPGVNILSTVPMSATAEMAAADIPTEAAAIDGTSMATPYVAGAATLYWSKNPSARPADVKARLLASVDKISSLRGKVQSGGRLNLAKLMGASR